jgi:hypothetical protein
VGNFIGHKGLGFRSVELLCDDVQIFSKLNQHATSFDGFCFGLASEADERDWLERVGEAEFASLVVGKTHATNCPSRSTQSTPPSRRSRRTASRR